MSVPKGLPLRLRPPSPVRITGVDRLVGGNAMPLTTVAIEKPLEIGIDDVLAAEFAVLDFTETAHEYAYRLHAADAWTPLAHRRQLTFVGLAPGRYSLEVRGRDAFGQWSASPPLEFEVVPRDGDVTIHQTAVFDPRGLGGLAYWYAIWPLHEVVFRRMLAGIVRHAVRSS